MTHQRDTAHKVGIKPLIFTLCVSRHAGGDRSIVCINRLGYVMVFNVNKVEYFGDMWLFKDINGKPVFTIDDQTAKEINGELLLRLIMIVADGVNSAI